MPLNCTGNEVESGCVLYSGPDIPSLSIKNGDTLDSIIGKFALGISQSFTIQDTPQLTTDTIKSKSLVRNPSAVNAAKIIKRDFSYDLQSTGSGSTVLTWDLVPLIRQLPTGYSAAMTRVNISGKPVSGSNVVSNSKSPSSSLTIPMDRYPLTIDFTVRVASPTGDVDMTTSLPLINPANTGNYRATLDAQDLNPQSGELSLTDHLNTLEAQVAELKASQSTMPNLKPDVEIHTDTIASLQDTISNPGALSVEYVDDGSMKSSDIKTLVTDLYSQVKTLKEKDNSRQAELVNLRNQLTSLS